MNAKITHRGKLCPVSKDMHPDLQVPFQVKKQPKPDALFPVLRFPKYSAKKRASAEDNSNSGTPYFPGTC
ncbi:hypothetical protein [Sphingobacterium sp. LRF_L2]|uniref:hypothetical protein n=1 Tax=Sphingobacterium sp. LRF_L2 TaxID=3369421 RepID=UPI003F6151EE